MSGTLLQRLLSDDFANVQVRVEGHGLTGRVIGYGGNVSVESVEVELNDGKRITVPLDACEELR